MIRKIKGYKKLNRAELKILFNQDISEFIFDNSEKPTTEERIAAMSVEDEMNVFLKHFPRVLFPNRVNTPDFASSIDLVAIEAKTISSLKNGFGNAFEKANRQFSSLSKDVLKIVVVNIDSLLNENCLEDIIGKSRLEADYRCVKNYILLSNGKIIYSC